MAIWRHLLRQPIVTQPPRRRRRRKWGSLTTDPQPNYREPTNIGRGGGGGVGVGWKNGRPCGNGRVKKGLTLALTGFLFHLLLNTFPASMAMLASDSGVPHMQIINYHTSDNYNQTSAQQNVSLSRNFDFAQNSSSNKTVAEVSMLQGATTVNDIPKSR